MKDNQKYVARERQKSASSLNIYTHSSFQILPLVTTTLYLWVHIPLYFHFFSFHPSLPLSLLYLLIEAGSLPRFSAPKRKAIVLSIKVRITVCFVSLYHLLLLLDAPVGLCKSFILQINSANTLHFLLPFYS